MATSAARTKAQEALRGVYAHFPPHEASKYRYAERIYVEALATVLDAFHGDLKGKKILDVGAGRGMLAMAFAALGAETSALEKYVFEYSDSTMFKEGDEQALLELWKRNGVTPIVADVSEMAEAVPAESCDCVVALEVIEHFKEPKRLLENVYRTVKPGGVVVMTTPNYGRLHARLRLLVGKNPKVDLETFYRLGERGFIGHWREYLPYELEEMFRFANFTSVRTHTFCDPLHVLRKGVSLYSLKQATVHLLSYLIPHGRYQVLVQARKQ